MNSCSFVVSPAKFIFPAPNTYLAAKPITQSVKCFCHGGAYITTVNTPVAIRATAQIKSRLNHAFRKRPTPSLV